jgi:hypothetical protein
MTDYVPLKINVALLRAAINKALDEVEQLRGSTVDVDQDLYWFIPQEVLHEVGDGTPPTGHTLGSLYDDWAQIEAVARGEKEPITYDLVWASALLRAVASSF